MSKLSIIVCCYSGVQTIKECLIGLSDQNVDKKSFDVIVVDDGSKDGTSETIQRYLANREGKHPEIKYFRKKNEGLSKARNFGVSKSSSPYVSFIDEDALADKMFVSNVIQGFQSNNDINCIGGRVELWNTGDYFASLYHYSLFNWLMYEMDAIIGTNMSFKKDFLVEVGGFDEDFDRRGDETMLFVKAGKKLKKIILDDVIIYHKQPNDCEHFIRTRFENGFYKAKAHLKGLKYEVSVLQILSRLVMYGLILILPWTFILLYIINPTLGLITLALLIAILVKRYVVNGELIGPLLYFKDSNMANSAKDYINIVKMILRGFYKHDLGYLIFFIKKINLRNNR